MIEPSARSRKPRRKGAAAPPTAALLSWYDAHRRVLPWRAAPGERADAYAVWLSEIMLQQTTVTTVSGYYETFLVRWPRVEALAAAPLDDVLAAWAGLGYYARARNLHACARIVTERHGGRFPMSEAELLRLPGVGPYTAAAIAAIAFEAPCVAVDGNVERVMSRLHAIDAPPRAAKALIRDKTMALLPHARPGDFAQALMDLGATVCTPRAPACGRCPLAPDCVARRADAQETYPIKAKKPLKPKRRGAAFILRRGDDVLLRRRAPHGLFGGMNAFPSTPLSQDIGYAEMRFHAPIKARWRALERPVSHVFTHFSLEMTVFVARTQAAAPANCRWAAAASLDKEGLPTLMRKAAECAGLIDG